jgi:hypothetical protein
MVLNLPKLGDLLKKYGQKYSRLLGIRLPSDAFKWLLASKLFAARISETIAINTYRKFAEAGLLTSKAIHGAGWDRLVEVLDAGGYVRYDFSTATKLLLITKDLIEKWKGNLNKLYKSCKNQKELEEKLELLGKGIGPVTVQIFLRELRGIWKLAEPLPNKWTISAALKLRMIKSRNSDKALIELKRYWAKHKMSGYDFVNFETALFRYGKIIQHK